MHSVTVGFLLFVVASCSTTKIMNILDHLTTTALLAWQYLTFACWSCLILPSHCFYRSSCTPKNNESIPSFFLASHSSLRSERWTPIPGHKSHPSHLPEGKCFFVRRDHSVSFGKWLPAATMFFNVEGQVSSLILYSSCMSTSSSLANPQLLLQATAN